MSDFDFQKDPFENFLALMAEAVEKKIPEPHAMTLSTINLFGTPASRIVLFKGIVRGGLSFYTNYQGEKAREIEKNPHVALNFFWALLEKQIRVEGKAEKISREESESYFRTRPRVSQLGAWASMQSEVLKKPEDLTERWNLFEKKFNGQDVPCPPHWGGFRVEAQKFEFWFGRQGRLHERYIYTKDKKNSWSRSMKYP